jgi:hypothetical protein
MTERAVANVVQQGCDYRDVPRLRVRILPDDLLNLIANGPCRVKYPHAMRKSCMGRPGVNEL